MMMRHAVVAGVVLGSLACNPRPETYRSANPPITAPSAPSVSEPWVAVAGYENPSLAATGSAVQDRVVADLDRLGITWAAGGSRGYTLNVPASRAAEARRALRTDETLARHVTIFD